jgi:hypothetical protein
LAKATTAQISDMPIQVADVTKNGFLFAVRQRFPWKKLKLHISILLLFCNFSFAMLMGLTNAAKTSLQSGQALRHGQRLE